MVPNKGRPAGRSANCAKLEEEGRVKLILATFQFPAELPALATAAFRVNKPAKKQWNWFFEALKIVAHRPASIPWKFHSKSSQRKIRSIPELSNRDTKNGRKILRVSSNVLKLIHELLRRQYKSLKIRSHMFQFKMPKPIWKKNETHFISLKDLFLSRYPKDLKNLNSIIRRLLKDVENFSFKLAWRIEFNLHYFLTSKPFLRLNSRLNPSSLKESTLHNLTQNSINFHHPSKERIPTSDSHPKAIFPRNIEVRRGRRSAARNERRTLRVVAGPRGL